MNITKSRELFLKIYNDVNLADTIEIYIKDNIKKVEKSLKLCNKNRWELVLKKEPKMKLSLVYAFLPVVYERYREKGIDDEIFFDTMSDIKIWIDDHKTRTGEWGLYELHWIMHHMNVNIFKLGRLQFQKLFYYGKKPYNDGRHKLSLGKKVVYVHIPRGERLDISKCEESFKMANEFFKKYYPEYPNDIFVCHSWLLHSGNKNYMKADGNIVRFSNLFNVTEEYEFPADTYLWVYGKKPKNKVLLKCKKKTGSYGNTENMPQNTSLQKALTEYINNGGNLGVSVGIKTI